MLKWDNVKSTRSINFMILKVKIVNWQVKSQSGKRRKVRKWHKKKSWEERNLSKRNQRKQKKRKHISSLKRFELSWKERRTRRWWCWRLRNPMWVCKKKFDLASILIHITRSEECEIFYGPRFNEMKEEHKSQRKQ